MHRKERMILKILFATTNKSKLKIIRKLFEDNGHEVISLKDLPDVEEPEETGSTCQENAILKAKYYKTKFPEYNVLADDSGIFIDKLGGAPGVYAARWAGENYTTEKIANKLISEFASKGIKESGASYVSSMALCYDDCDGKTITIAKDGITRGIIKPAKKGELKKVCYEAFFYVNENDTLAYLRETNYEEYLKYSNRVKAGEMILKYLKMI